MDEMFNFNDIRETLESGIYWNRYSFLYTDKKVDRSSVPNGWFQYELRGNHETKKPEKIRPLVLSNFVGTIFTTEELPLENGMLPVDEVHELLLFIGVPDLKDFNPNELSVDKQVRLSESLADDKLTAGGLFDLFGEMGIIPFIQEKDDTGNIISEYPLTREEFEKELEDFDLDSEELE